VRLLAAVLEAMEPLRGVRFTTGVVSAMLYCDFLGCSTVHYLLGCEVALKGVFLLPIGDLIAWTLHFSIPCVDRGSNLLAEVLAGGAWVIGRGVSSVVRSTDAVGTGRRGFIGILTAA